MPLVTTGHPVILSSSARHGAHQPGGWLSAPQQRDRKGLPVGDVVNIGGRQVQVTGGLTRWLTFAEMWTAYRRVPDLRAAVDSVVRRVATWDWTVEPCVDPADPQYEALMKEAETQRRFLVAPNTDGDTWQELATKFCTDLLVFDQAALEPVVTRGKLTELVALRGCTILPCRDELGRLLNYTQDPALEYGAGFGSSGHVATFQPEELVFLRLFPTTAGGAGNSLVEAIIDEVITVLRAAEHTMLAFDADEIPPGIVVLSGIAGKAADAAKADLQSMKGQDHKIRVLTTPDPTGKGAAWVELRHTPKDLSMREIVNDIRRVIWRVFGVTPVEMGSTEDVNRSTAEVQLAVGSSHLVSPILEAIEGKLNARVLPLLASKPELVGMTRFTFERDARLTPGESLSAAQRLKVLVDGGIITRNEARSMEGLRPIDGGDALTTAAVTYPLGAEPPAPKDPPGGGGDGSGDGEGGSAGSSDPQDESPGEANKEQAARPNHAHDHPRRGRDGDLPSDWQPMGRFRGHRTLDLRRLGEAIAGYAREVRPLWRQAEDEVLAALGAAWDETRGGLTEDDAARANDALDAAMDRLLVNWRATTGPRYVEAARVGRDASARFTGVASAAEDYEATAEAYFSAAMGYLAAESGPVVQAKRAVQQLVQRATQGHRGRPAQRALSEAHQAIVDEAVLLAKAEAAMRAEEFRILHWSGKLNELANDVLARSLDALSVAEAAEGRVVTEWMCEWVEVGDAATCGDCAQEAARGFVPVSSLRTRPGGDTACRGNCRCVLVMWTREEVDNGRAVRLGPVEQGG